MDEKRPFDSNDIMYTPLNRVVRKKGGYEGMKVTYIFLGRWNYFFLHISTYHLRAVYIVQNMTSVNIIMRIVHTMLLYPSNIIHIQINYFVDFFSVL